MDQLGKAYDWSDEDERYGELPLNMNRASDKSDSDIDTPAERRLYLSERLRVRAMKAELGQKSPGLLYMVKMREVAKYEWMKRAGNTLTDFDASYPRFKFDKDHDFIRVTVRSCNFFLKKVVFNVYKVWY